MTVMLARALRRLPRVLHDASFPWTNVQAVLLGGPGRAILAAGVEDWADLATLAERATQRRRNRPLRALAWTGLFREPHRHWGAIQWVHGDCLVNPLRP